MGVGVGMTLTQAEQLKASVSAAYFPPLQVHPGLPAWKKGARISGFYNVMGLNEWFLTPNFQLQFRHGFSNRIEGNKRSTGRKMWNQIFQCSKLLRERGYSFIHQIFLSSSKYLSKAHSGLVWGYSGEHDPVYMGFMV